jgi:hypothetical protein
VTDDGIADTLGAAIGDVVLTATDNAPQRRRLCGLGCVSATARRSEDGDDKRYAMLRA